MKNVLKYPGSKNRVVEWICSMIPHHEVYLEPYFGSGAVFFKRDNKNIYPKIHPTQKPIGVLKQLIEIFTDEGDVVIDPVCGSGSTLRACQELNRSAYGFEIDKNFYKRAKEEMLNVENRQISV